MRQEADLQDENRRKMLYNGYHRAAGIRMVLPGSVNAVEQEVN